MVTINGTRACRSYHWIGLCPHELTSEGEKTCICCFPDVEIYRAFGDGPSPWQFVAYWLIGTAVMFAGQWIAIHLFGVRLQKFRVEEWEPLLSDLTVQLWMLFWDLGAAFIAILAVGAAWAIFDDEDGTGRLIQAEIKGKIRYSAKFNITLRLCVAYGLSFGVGQLVVSWLLFLHDATAIPELVACFYGVVIGLHHVRGWANWHAVERCKATYKHISCLCL